MGMWLCDSDAYSMVTASRSDIRPCSNGTSTSRTHTHWSPTGMSRSDRIAL